MAKLIYGPNVTQMVNKVGSVVYFRGRTGDTVRAAGIVTQVLSDRRIAVRSAWTTCRNAWQNILTQNQRDAWEDQAKANPQPMKLSYPRPLIGFQWYMKCAFPKNYYLATDPLTDPPTDFTHYEPTDLTFTAITAVPPTLSVAIAKTKVGIGPDPFSVAILWSYLPLPASRKGRPPWYATFDGDYLDNIPTDNFAGTYQLAFGPMVVGQRIHIQAELLRVDGGPLSQKIRASALIT